MSGSLSVGGVFLVIAAFAVAGVIGLVWGLVGRLYRERLAWRAIAFTLAETNRDEVQEWEIRAMAALLYGSLPWWMKRAGEDWVFELLAVTEWAKGAAWYAEHEPRLNEELFGDTGPF